MEGADLQDVSEQSQCYFLIKLKNKYGRSELQIPISQSGEETFLFLCHHLRIPPEKIRLVCRGKIVTKDNISSFINNGAVFQAFGEEAEDETGLDVRDIEVLMKQLLVERNVAVKALRKTGDLIDAILYVSDNM